MPFKNYEEANKSETKPVENKVLKDNILKPGKLCTIHPNIL